MTDLQKPNMWKRISAALLDVLVLVLLASAAMLLLSRILGVDDRSEELEAVYARYGETYGVDLSLSQTEREALSDEDEAKLIAAEEAFFADTEALYILTMFIQLTLLTVIFGMLLAFLVAEFAVPLLLGNGQTLGKKLFGIGVMQQNGVRLTAPLLFARSILGKYTVETMIPVMVILLLNFGMMGAVGLLILAALAALQLALLIGTHERLAIHDKLAHTVTVDLASQTVYGSYEELLAAKTRRQAELANAPEGGK